MSTDLLTREDVQRRRGNVWAYVSPSRLNCWLGCPLKFKLLYIDGLRQPTTPSLFLGRWCASMQTFIVIGWGSRSKRPISAAGGFVAAIGAERNEVPVDSGGESLQRAMDQWRPTCSNCRRTNKPLAVEAAVKRSSIRDRRGLVSLVGIMGCARQPGRRVIADFEQPPARGEPLETTREIQLGVTPTCFAARARGGRPGDSQSVKTKVPRSRSTATRPAPKLIYGVSSRDRRVDDLHARRFIFRRGSAVACATSPPRTAALGLGDFRRHASPVTGQRRSVTATVCRADAYPTSFSDT